MSYFRTRNQEISIKIRPTEASSDILFNRSEDFYKEITSFLMQKYPEQFKTFLQEKVGIDFFTKKILFNENFSFVKFGDGELICMIGAIGKNCDDHPYSKRLGRLLEESFVKLLKLYNDTYLAEWIDNLVKTRENYINANGLKPKFADYECFLTLDENLKDKKLLNFYKLIKNSKRNKIFVGPKKLRPVVEMLNIDKFVEVPIIDAFSSYDSVLKDLINYEVKNDNIYIFCCSMMSCVLCSDLKEINQNITLLDIGSGFDPIFSEKTRPKQPTIEKCLEYYKDIIPSSFKVKKTKNAVGKLNKSLSKLMK